MKDLESVGLGCGLGGQWQPHKQNSWCFLYCSGQCLKGFPCTKAFNPHHNPMSHVTIIFSLFPT